MRTLIADVSLLAEPDVGKARIGIRWHTGATDEIVVTRYQKVTQWGHTDPAAVDMVRSLAHLEQPGDRRTARPEPAMPPALAGHSIAVK